jgi:hypothetical protein
MRLTREEKTSSQSFSEVFISAVSVERLPTHCDTGGAVAV